ncbi:MAG: HipA domain-containing protein [Bacteroidetes bacterium]|nr:HipA domain-containing protein [Bacteroidota bacterium]MBS1540424.1 HipA domain-containing protein [Bacteroidota bacterium]
MKRCLYCYQPLAKDEIDFHLSCSKKMFGQATPPELPYDENDMGKLADQIIKRHTTVPGVQPKLSLEIEKTRNGPSRFTIVGLWGNFILKPPSDHYPQIPEVEDLTMHLASLAKIKVVPHTLIRLKSGSLAYLTKRIDRAKKEKLHMEDMCQLTERLTEQKYQGSYEQIAKAIAKYSANPGLDIVNFYEVVLFSFLTGNADMHLKNFSLIKNPSLGYHLSPAYDLVATALVNPADNEDLALALNGKKRKISRKDFSTVISASGIDKKQEENIFKRMEKASGLWFDFIDHSFLDKKMKKDYKELITGRFNRIT